MVKRLEVLEASKTLRKVVLAGVGLPFVAVDTEHPCQHRISAAQLGVPGLVIRSGEHAASLALVTPSVGHAYKRGPAHHQSGKSMEGVLGSERTCDV